MIGWSPLGAGLGAVCGSGLWLAVRSSPPMRRPRLDDRLAPYLIDRPRQSRLLAATGATTSVGAAERLVGPTLKDLARRVDGWVGGSASVRRRLARAGSGMTLEAFRVEQVLYGAVGLGVGLLLALLAAVRGAHRSPIALVIVAGVFAVFGVMLRDQRLSRQVRRREARMVAEFPTIAEMLALAVGAGESPVSALERVSRIAGGELSGEIRRVLADNRAGATIVTALEALAMRTALPAVIRFVDGMAIAVERGTPLAEVLRAQAADAREEGRRALLEAGGRKEIAMLIPVVFFVLPVTVVFALFPGFYGLRLAVP
ncbi:MAG: type II secretion system F family protein [Mycobacteriales bacterium]